MAACRSTYKTRFQWFIAMMLLLVLTGCGGSGSKESTSNNPPNEPETLQPALITRNNAETLLDSSFSFIYLSRDASQDFPVIARLLWQDMGAGTINQVYSCDNTDGSLAVTGSLSEDGTGEILMTYTQCLNSSYQAKINGAIRVAIHGLSGFYLPVNFTVGFESYETASSSGSYRNILNGTVTVSPNAGGGQTAIASLRLDDPVHSRYIQTNSMTLYYDVSAGNVPQASTTRVYGTVENSEWGTVSLSSGSSLAEYLRAWGAGNSSVRAAFLDDEHFVATLDANGDAVVDAYLHASVNDLDRDYGVNDNPVMAINDTLMLEQNSISISLLDITDADYDFLDFSISLISSPPDSHFDWSIDDAMNLRINVDKVGEYVFVLTANDGRSGVARKEIHVRFLLHPPDVKLETTTFEYAIGDHVAIDFSPANSDQGPFTYKISAAIPGMTISPSGLLDWQISLLEHYFPHTEVHITVTVSNTDHDVAIPLTFGIVDHALKHPVVRSGIDVPIREGNIHVGDFDKDGIAEILLTDNRNLMYTLEWRNGQYVQDWIYPYDINAPGETIDAILPYDSNGDGLYEIYVQTGTVIKVVNIATNSVTHSLDLAPFMGTIASSDTFGTRIALADLDNDGITELVAMVKSDLGNSDMALVLGANGLDLRWQTPPLALGSGMAIGNVDTDSAMEIVFAGGYVFDGSTQTNEWAYATAFGDDIVVADIDGSGVDKIIANRGLNPPVIYNAVMKSPLFEIPGADDVCSIAAADLDGDSKKEILIGYCQRGNVTAYDADAGSAEEIWSVDFPGDGAVGLAVGDADQDGNLEVIRGSGTNSSGEDTLIVFDSVHRVIDFRNVNPSQLDGPYTGGWALTGTGKEGKVVFGVARTDSGFQGSRLLALDYDTGDMEISPEVGSNWSARFSFGVADYDLDGTDEVLLGSAEIYNGFLAAYDLYGAAREWSVAGDHGTAGYVSCGDANGDGHADILATWGPSVRLYDPFNQVLLWSSIRFTEYLRQVALHDLDGDHVPEILILTATQLTVYSGDGSTYVEAGTYLHFGGHFNNMLVKDIDGDTVPEIVVAEFDDFRNSNSNILVLNADLSLESSFTVEGGVTAMSAAQDQNALLFAIILAPGNYGEEQNYVQLFDMQNNAPIWRSPLLLGPVTRDSMHMVQKPGTLKKRLAIGTMDAMYITQ